MKLSIEKTDQIQNKLRVYDIIKVFGINIIYTCFMTDSPFKKELFLPPFYVTITQFLHKEIHIISYHIDQTLKYTTALTREKLTSKYQEFQDIILTFTEADLNIQKQDKKLSLVFFKNTKIDLLCSGRSKLPKKLLQLKSKEEKQQKVPYIQDMSIQVIANEKDEDLMQQQVFDGSKKRVFQKQALLDKNIQIKNLQKKQYPYNCLCLLTQTFQSSMTSIGTGCILTPFIVLTCAHNLFHTKTKKYFKKMTATFGDRQINIKSVYYLPIYKENLIKGMDTEQYDFALLLLEKPYILTRYMSISSNFQKYSVAQIPGFPLNSYDKNGEKKSNKQFSKGQIKGSSNLVSCGVYNLLGSKDMILQFEKDLMLYKITTSSGQSGSPIIVELYGGYYFIIGIHIASVLQSNRNAGVRLTEQNVMWIMKWKNCLTTQIICSKQIDSSKYSKLAFQNINYVPYQDIQVKKQRFSEMLQYRQTNDESDEFQQCRYLNELLTDQQITIPIISYGFSVAMEYQWNLEHKKSIKILKMIRDSLNKQDQLCMMMKAEVNLNLARVYRKLQRSIDINQTVIPAHKQKYIKHNFYQNSCQHRKQAKAIYETLPKDQEINKLKIAVQRELYTIYTQNKVRFRNQKLLNKLIDNIIIVTQKQSSPSIKQQLAFLLHSLYIVFGQILCEQKYFVDALQFYQKSINALYLIYDHPNKLFVEVYRLCFRCCLKRQPTLFKKGIEYGYKALTILKQKSMENTKYGVKILIEYEQCIKQMIKASRDKTDLMKAIQALKSVYYHHFLINQLEYKISSLK